MSSDESTQSIEAILARFVGDQLLYDRASASVEPEEPLLGNLLDSMDILKLVEYVEDQFGVQLADSELVPENFGTLRAVATLVARKSDGQA